MFRSLELSIVEVADSAWISRQKLKQYFYDVTALIFVVDLSVYDQYAGVAVPMEGKRTQVRVQCSVLLQARQTSTEPHDAHSEWI